MTAINARAGPGSILPGHVAGGALRQAEASRGHGTSNPVISAFSGDSESERPERL